MCSLLIHLDAWTSLLIDLDAAGTWFFFICGSWRLVLLYLWKLALGSSLFVEVDTSTLMLIGVFSIDVFVVDAHCRFDLLC
jgi:hypothetical protein